ncbi:MAG: thioredoxin family protein [Halobacteriota archaeon]
MMDDELDQLRAQRRAELEEQLKSPSIPETPVHVDDASHFDELVESFPVVLVDFHADWCGPCKMLEPIVERLASTSDAAIVKVDVDRHQQLAARHSVRGVPTMVLYVDGEPTEHLVGLRDESTLRGLIDQHAG